jgi:choline dehydrogenase-like flavoprotein
VSGVIHHGADLTEDQDLQCDVCIIGSGAGGAVLAAGLAERGLKVVVLEEGGWFTKADFNLEEASAYPMLYQDRGGRATADLAITVLQGRSVGGSTTVNWTTCFRTPATVLDHWAAEHGISGLDTETLRPHFEAVEARLGIQPWPESIANANNRVLYDGCKKLDWEVQAIRRNVRECGNTGYCGLGCPLDAKQAMGITYIEDAVSAGARVYSDVKADRLVVRGGRVEEVEARVLNRHNSRPTGVRIRVRARTVVSSAGAINGPALLLRSGLDEKGLVGKRTFLHPVVALPAYYEEAIEGFHGAPQSVSSHQFIDRGPDRFGFFMEAAPLQPVLAVGGSMLIGAAQQEMMGRLPHMGVLIALAADGFLEGDSGGTVSLRSDGRVRLDYPVSERLAESFRAAHVAMARISMAAGAQLVQSTHTTPVHVRLEADLAALKSAPYGALEHPIFSAHQMGGCPMGSDPSTSVVNPDFGHHEVRNLFVVDGSVLPTSLGVNPSETIYALSHLATKSVAHSLLS